VTRFSFRDQDEIFVLDQSFDDDRPPPTTTRGGGHVAAPPPTTTTRPEQIRSAGSWR
jgi:hypothetical protein